MLDPAHRHAIAVVRAEAARQLRELGEPQTEFQRQVADWLIDVERQATDKLEGR